MNAVKGLILKGYCRVSAAKCALKNRIADENVSKVAWIVIVFLVAAIFLTVLITGFNSTIKTWFNATLGSWFPAAGELRPTT